MAGVGIHADHWARLGLALTLGCSKTAVPREPAASAVKPTAPIASSPARSAATPATDMAAAGRGTANEQSNSPLCGASAPTLELAATAFVKVHAGPVLSAAVGTPPRVALWSGRSVTLLDGKNTRELPPPVLPPGANVEVFFGRDDQPRLMGFAPREPGNEIPVYLRLKQGSFRPEPSELGPLAGPRGALYGVLGFADPEVVCRPNDRCLVKRTTGWARAPAQQVPVRIVLRSGNVFALHAEHIERLGDAGWVPLEPARPFDHPLDVWPSPNGELWVVDRSTTGLARLRGAAWEVIASPIREPRAVFGRTEHAMLVVGSNGAAEFDGSRFRCSRDVEGPLALAFAVGNELWVAGESGVYRSVP